VTAADRAPGDEGGFEAFFERHHRELSRLAYLLTGDHGAADDLTGDAFLAVWRQWDRVRDRDEPLAYVRRMVLNMAASRVRRLVRERRRDGLIEAGTPRATSGPDGAAVVDVRVALQRLPARRRACVVLRHAFDLSEQDVARLLGISVGTVKSQTARGVAQLQGLLDDRPAPGTAGGPAPGGRDDPGPRPGTGSRHRSAERPLRELSHRWTA
jgi:RNA polymerase sigma-70 factor (sigma-E family)